MHKNTSQVRFEGLTAVSIQTTVFWDMIPCSLHGQSLIFCTNTLLLSDALKVMASGSCVLVCIHQTAQHLIPEDSYLYIIVNANVIIFFFVIYFCGIWAFSSSRKHLLITLLRLEFVVLVLYFSIYYYLCNFHYSLFLLFIF